MEDKSLKSFLETKTQSVEEWEFSQENILRIISWRDHSSCQCTAYFSCLLFLPPPVPHAPLLLLSAPDFSRPFCPDKKLPKTGYKEMRNSVCFFVCAYVCFCAYESVHVLKAYGRIGNLLTQGSIQSKLHPGPQRKAVKNLSNVKT